MRIRLSLVQKNLEKFMDMVISKYHFEASDKEELIRVYGQIEFCMAPYAIYRINQRATGIKAIDDGQSAIVAMTLGEGVDRLKEQYENDDNLPAAYKLDCITNELLMGMYKEFNSAYAKFHRRYVWRYYFIGDEIGIENIPGLLEELYKRPKNDKSEAGTLKDNDEIVSNEYGVLFPSKSVIFYALLSEHPDSICEGICVGCGNIGCENRMSDNQSTKASKRQEEIENQKKELDKTNIAFNYGYRRIFGS